MNERENSATGQENVPSNHGRVPSEVRWSATPASFQGHHTLLPVVPPLPGLHGSSPFTRNHHLKISSCSCCLSVSPRYHTVYNLQKDL